MTDKEIGRIVREIAAQGKTAEVKRKGNGIIILENNKKIVKSDTAR